MSTEKLSITISEEFARELRKHIPPRKRSKFMEDAAWRRLRIAKQKHALKVAAGAWKEADHPEIAGPGVDKWLRDVRSSWDRLPRVTGKKR